MRPIQAKSNPNSPKDYRTAQARAELVTLLAERDRRQRARGASPEEEQARALEASLGAYVRAAWPILVPGRPMVHHFALDAICDHLQAVSAGHIKKLVINVPPGMAKSTLVAVLWPTWEWTWRPGIQWLFATYTKSLTYRDAARRRDIIRSSWYQELWASRFQVTGEGVEFLRNSTSGHMFSTSTGGQTTGWRGDRLVLDDPQDPKGVESEIKNESMIEWLTRTWPTRINRGTPYAGEVLIQQRLAERDATGLYLKQGNCVHLKIPLEYEGRSISTPLFTDPRTQEREIISEELYPRKDTEDLKRTLGPYATAGQLQQSPAPHQGGIIQRAWIRHHSVDSEGRLALDKFSVDPMGCIRFCTVDPAVKEAEVDKPDPDWTVIASWTALKVNDLVYLLLLDLVRRRMEGPDIVPQIKAMHDHWKFSLIGVETFGFQLSIFQEARRKGLPVREMSNAKDALYRIDRDKVARAFAATPLMADGRFWVPTYAPWLGDYIGELMQFPKAAHDDQVDVTSAAVAIANTLRLTPIVYGRREEVSSRLTPYGVEDTLPFRRDDDKPESPWDAIRVPRP